nr:MAG TPA: hypothetical protein [Caudoviricetes sp.]
MSMLFPSLKICISIRIAYCTRISYEKFPIIYTYICITVLIHSFILKIVIAISLTTNKNLRIV